MTTRLTFIHALSPLHAGIGQGSGVIDLPIAREKSTDIPYLPGSSLKGALRTRCFDTHGESDCNTLFGKDTTDNQENTASLLQISDQRLISLPVRSLAGTFAWITSPFVLSRLARDCQNFVGIQTELTIPPLRGKENLQQCYLASGNSPLLVQEQGTTKKQVFLEDLDLKAKHDQATENWARWLSTELFAADDTWKNLFIQRFCVVHDDIFSFLVQTATEVKARIRLKENEKTVNPGGLWYEETLPAESILSGIMMLVGSQNDKYKNMFKELTRNVIQLGGKSTVGHGLCRLHLSEEGKQ